MMAVNLGTARAREAQELMRRFGCRFETRLVYSRSLETGSSVLDAKFKGFYSKVEVNGRIKKVKKFKLIVQAKVAKSGNDYILLFSDNPDAPGNQLPLSSKSRAAKRENSSFRLFLRETATGRAAVGAEDLRRYAARCAELAPPDLLAWLHR